MTKPDRGLLYRESIPKLNDLRHLFSREDDPLGKELCFVRYDMIHTLVGGKL